MNILEAIDKAEKAANSTKKISEVDRMNQEFDALLRSIKWNESFSVEADSLMKQMEFNANFSQTYLNKMLIDGMEEQKKATIAMKNATVSMKRATKVIAFFAFVQLLIAIYLCFKPSPSVEVSLKSSTPAQTIPYLPSSPRNQSPPSSQH